MKIIRGAKLTKFKTMPQNQAVKKEKPGAAAAAADTILEAMVDGISIANLQNRLIYGNKALAELLGYDSVDEMLGMDTTDLVPKREIPRIMEAGKKCIKKRTLRDFETIALRKDGGEVPVRLNATTLKDPNGKLIGNMSVIRDITKQKKEEEALREFGKRFRELADSISDVFFTFDKNLKYTYWNKASEKLTGIPAEKALGKSLYDLFPRNEETRRAEKAYREVLKTGRPKTFISQYHLGDKEFFFEISAYPSQDGLSVFVKDITERRKAEEEIKKLSSAIEQSIDGVAIADLETKLLYVNNAFARMHSYSINELIGKRAVILHNKEQIKEFKERLHQIKTKGSWEGEIDHIRKDGTPFPIYATVTLLKDEQEKPTGIIAICRDITEGKETKEVVKRLKEIDKLKDDFLNISAHEFKTPLTTIIGLSEVMGKRRLSLDSESQKYISIIHEEGIKLSRIVKKMLTVTRYESGGEVLYNESFNLVSFILSLLSNFNLIKKKKKLRLVTDIEKKKIVITSDKEKISQIIYNFVDNAVKYGPAEQTITISITKPKRGWVKIAVTDEGPGIPSALQKRLFTKFVQLESSLSRTQEGTGLGLYICKLIVGKLGGKIGVKSALGKGSTFYFTLPLKSKS